MRSLTKGARADGNPPVFSACQRWSFAGLARFALARALIAGNAVTAAIVNIERAAVLSTRSVAKCAMAPQVHKYINKLPVKREELGQIVAGWQRYENLR